MPRERTWMDLHRRGRLLRDALRSSKRRHDVEGREIMASKEGAREEKRPHQQSPLGSPCNARARFVLTDPTHSAYQWLVAISCARIDVGGPRKTHQTQRRRTRRRRRRPWGRAPRGRLWRVRRVVGCMCGGKGRPDWVEEWFVVREEDVITVLSERRWWCGNGAQDTMCRHGEGSG
jgi:hypothetical protein